MRRKTYITIEDLWSWAAKVQGTGGFDDDLKDQVEKMFQNAAKLFDGTQSYIDPADGLTKSYPYIANYADFFNYYVEEFPDRLLARPLEVGRINPTTGRAMTYDQAMYVIFSIIRRQINHFTQINHLKYENLLETLQYDYNPIENYNMIEDGTDDKTYAGAEQSDHDVKANQLGGLEISGPLNSYTLDTSSATPTMTISFDMNKKVETVQNGVSDTRAGQQAGGVSATSVTTQNGQPFKSSNFTTTYDNSGENRLKDYNTTEGTSASVQMGVGSVDVPVQGKAYSGAPNSPSYKDTKTYNGRADNGQHHLTRKGNIGVTTTQQMIEQEREKARINLFREFVDELNKYILLSTWD